MPVLSRCFIRAALGYLVLGFTLGATMLVLKALARHGASARLLAPHVEFLVMGWTLQLTMGVGFWILPRLAGGTSRGAVGYAWLAFVLVNLGVLATGLGPVVGVASSVRLFGRAAEAAGAIAFGLHAWRRVKAANVPSPP